jgi:23S rRNA (uridine2552-2'-O)-methyltransferase
MSPNISGIDLADQARAMQLAELALGFAVKHMNPGGSFLVKVFQGSGFEEFLHLIRKHFERVATRKPDASRSRSNELYLLAQGLRGDPPASRAKASAK